MKKYDYRPIFLIFFRHFHFHDTFVNKVGLKAGQIWFWMPILSKRLQLLVVLFEDSEASVCNEWIFLDHFTQTPFRVATDVYSVVVNRNHLQKHFLTTSSLRPEFHVCFAALYGIRENWCYNYSDINIFQGVLLILATAGATTAAL